MKHHRQKRVEKEPPQPVICLICGAELPSKYARKQHVCRDDA